MKTITTLALIAIFGLLGSCTINPHSMDMTQAVQSARTRSDHDNLAKHYEEATKEMQTNVAEHKKRLAQYEANKGLYGKQSSSLISHCQGLIRVYEQAAKENLGMAESHRQMASQTK
jgi:ssDNA-specific exonuclease RecJ